MPPRGTHPSPALLPREIDGADSVWATDFPKSPPTPNQSRTDIPKSRPVTLYGGATTPIARNVPTIKTVHLRCPDAETLIPNALKATSPNPYLQQPVSTAHPGSPARHPIFRKVLLSGLESCEQQRGRWTDSITAPRRPALAAIPPQRTRITASKRSQDIEPRRVRHQYSQGG